MHILIVDDDPHLRVMLERLLAKEGHTTCWAASGKGALSLLRTENVDAVILDILLGPGEMTGWDIAREKLLDPAIRSIPVIILSGLAPADIRQGAKVVSDALSGATLILSKPVDIDVLKRALELLAPK